MTVVIEEVDYGNPEHVKQRLAYIAYRIKAGDPYKKFEKELERLTGTELEERDEEAEEKWEKEYRRDREE